MKLIFVAAWALLALSALDRADSSAYDKIVTHSRIRAKNEGPNVCALQQVEGTKKKYFSTCRNWYQGTICGKKATVLYECCPGYMRLDGQRGCPAVAPIDTVYGTLGLVKATTTQKYADMSTLREEIEGAGSFTMFTPSNEAWELLDPEVRSGLVSNVNVELYNALHYHMVDGRHPTKDLKNGMMLTSKYLDLGLYINHYRNGVVTVNCARIINGNQIATNGVVHVIDRVITMAATSIRDIIEVKDELSTLSALAQEAGLLDKLGEPGQMTLFAPTDDAFDKIDREVLNRLMGDKGVLQALLKYHLLKSVQCSEAIMAGSYYETEEGSNIEIGCDGDSLTVNGIKMVLKKDIVASNGVIHLIDQVLMPDSAKDVMELVGPSESRFSDMVAELGLQSAMKPKAEYTLLAPLNSALSDDIMRKDHRLLKIILQNHIVNRKMTLSKLYNGQVLETLGGKLLRVFIYRTAVCIENACMVRGSKEGSNGALHLMRTLIKPAETSMFERLKVDGRFKIFLTLMEKAGLTDLLNQEGGFTLFAPTDDAFAGLSKEDMVLLTRDIDALRTILLYHVSRRIFINGGLEGGVTNLLKSIQGGNLQVLSVNNSIRVNSLNVSDNDLMASNGVIHVVKTLLYPKDLPVGSEDLQILLKRLIKYIQIKYQPGYKYTVIPLTFLRRTITTHVVTDPEIKKVTRIIPKEPDVTTVTRIVEGDPDFTTVTRVITGEGSLTEVTKVVEADPSVIKVTFEGEVNPSASKITKIIEGQPAIKKITRVVEDDPKFTKVTRVIEGVSGQLDADGELKRILEEEGGQGFRTTVARVVSGEPHIIKGPDFSKIGDLKKNPELIDEESERITKIIKEARPVKKRLAVRRRPAGMKKRKQMRRPKPEQ